MGDDEGRCGWLYGKIGCVEGLEQVDVGWFVRGER
jgi:hypothetical protein